MIGTQERKSGLLIASSEIQPFSMITPWEWDENSERRIGLIDEIIKDEYFMGDDFSQIKGEELRKLALSSGRKIWHNLAYSLDLAVFVGKGGPFFILRNHYFEHNAATLESANRLLQRLVPGQGLDIHTDFATAKKRARSLRNWSIADIAQDGQWVEFATVIPGMTLAYLSGDTESMRQAVVIQPNLTGRAQPPNW